MPRARRVCFPGAVYHVLQRGNRKQNIFYDDIDRWHLLKLFLEAKKKFAYLLYCYALMINHFHLTIETPNAIPISKIMHFVESSYAIYFNKRHGSTGHLFQGRFKDILVEKEAYLLELSRYVHLNPVRAGVVRKPEDYKWSSYSIYMGLRNDILVDTGFVLNYFGTPSKKDSRENYKEFVVSGIETTEDGKDWLEKNLIRKRFLASKNFIRKFKKRGQAPFGLTS